MLVKKIPLSSIVIAPDRQRTDLGDVLSLANSIKANGQLQPIIVNELGDDKYLLVAGERRYTAHTLLKAETINAVLQKDMSQDFMQIVEWEENFRRKQLDWKEECTTFLKLHEMKGEDWTIEKTGEFFGVEMQPAYTRILVGKALRDAIPYVMNAPNLTAAFKAAQRSMKRMMDREATNIIKAFDVILPVDEPEEEIPLVTSRETMILNEDFFNWARSYKGPKFSFIHLDPPYGIKHNRSEQGSAAMFPLYKDMPEDFLEFLAILAETLPNLIDDQAHIMLWYSASKFSLTKKFIEQNFPDIRWGGSAKGDDPVPLIWHKDDATGIVPDPERYGRRVYETALCFSIGDRKIIRPVLNAFDCPGRKTTDTRHVSEKPVEMLTHFMRMFVDEHTNVLDPCCGSGNSIIAAYKLQSPYSVGLELDPNVASESKVHLELATLNASL